MDMFVDSILIGRNHKFRSGIERLNFFVFDMDQTLF